MHEMVVDARIQLVCEEMQSFSRSRRFWVDGLFLAMVCDDESMLRFLMCGTGGIRLLSEVPIPSVNSVVEIVLGLEHSLCFGTDLGSFSRQSGYATVDGEDGSGRRVPDWETVDERRY